MDTQPEATPAVVPLQAKQAGEVRLRWIWTEPSVWTERMLTALEHGVKGGVWYSLIDKVYSTANLAAATAKVAANKGAAGGDHVTVEQFCLDAAENLRKLREQLRQATYQPQAIRRVYIPKLGST